MAEIVTRGPITCTIASPPSFENFKGEHMLFVQALQCWKAASIQSFRSLKNDQYSTEGQISLKNLAPVLVMNSGNSLVFSRKIVASTGFYPILRPRHVSTNSGNK